MDRFPKEIGDMGRKKSKAEKQQEILQQLISMPKESNRQAIPESSNPTTSSVHFSLKSSIESAINVRLKSSRKFGQKGFYEDANPDLLLKASKNMEDILRATENTVISADNRIVALTRFKWTGCPRPKIRQLNWIQAYNKFGRIDGPGFNFMRRDHRSLLSRNFKEGEEFTLKFPFRSKLKKGQENKSKSNDKSKSTARTDQKTEQKDVKISSGKHTAKKGKTKTESEQQKERGSISFSEDEEDDMNFASRVIVEMKSDCVMNSACANIAFELICNPEGTELLKRLFLFEKHQLITEWEIAKQAYCERFINWKSVPGMIRACDEIAKEMVEIDKAISAIKCFGRHQLGLKMVPLIKKCVKARLRRKRAAEKQNSPKEQESENDGENKNEDRASDDDDDNEETDEDKDVNVITHATSSMRLEEKDTESESDDDNDDEKTDEDKDVNVEKDTESESDDDDDDEETDEDKDVNVEKDTESESDEDIIDYTDNEEIEEVLEEIGRKDIDEEMRDELFRARKYLATSFADMVKITKYFNYVLITKDISDPCGHSNYRHYRMLRSMCEP